MSKITTVLKTGVTLGSPGYLGPLSITSTGGIEPTVQGQPALYIPANAVKPTLINSGILIGGSDYRGGGNQAGGMGVDVQAAAIIMNENAIKGGYGEFNEHANGTNGGIGTGIFSAGTTLTNDALIVGGNGGGSAIDNAGYGGAGLAIYAASTVLNFGSIDGGAGGTSEDTTLKHFMGDGGKGVLLSGGATLINAGYINGGYGGPTYVFGGPAGGYGGEGLSLNHASATNLGFITGGQGGSGTKYNYVGGIGGIGVEDDFGRFSNQGSIFGGLGGFGTTSAGPSGDGVDLSGAGAFGKNTGLIEGGRGLSAGNYGYAAGEGGAGLTIAAAASFTNAGQIIGGDGGDGGPNSGEYGARAGAGAILRGATVTNSGLIMAGRGGYEAAGVSGAILYGAKLVNSGTVIGGYGGQGDTGGNGIVAGSIGTVQSQLNNSGTIIGGAGGYSYSGGTGGIGVQISATSVINTGHILGGTGGSALHQGGNGGYGADIFGGTLTNKGFIEGGAGGASRYNYSGGSGGGVRMEGGTLINAGTIATSAAYGAAVYLTRTAIGTVVVEPGAVFSGYVDAYRTQNDVLVLAGKSKQTFTGIGTQIYGFKIIDFAAGAKWHIAGTAAGLTQGQHIDGFKAGDSIKITNAAIASGTVSVKTAGVLTVSAAGGSFTINVDGAMVGATNFQFSNDTLTETKTKAAMVFLAPAAAQVPAGESLPPLQVTFMASPQAGALSGGPPTGALVSQWTIPAVAGFVHDLPMTTHQSVATMVTRWPTPDDWSNPGGH
jgi:hypothetical protein